MATKKNQFIDTYKILREKLTTKLAFNWYMWTNKQ